MRLILAGRVLPALIGSFTFLSVTSLTLHPRAIERMYRLPPGGLLGTWDGTLVFTRRATVIGDMKQSAALTAHAIAVRVSRRVQEWVAALEAHALQDNPVCIPLATCRAPNHDHNDDAKKRRSQPPLCYDHSAKQEK